MIGGLHIRMDALMPVSQDRQAAAREEHPQKLILQGGVILRFIDDNMPDGIENGSSFDRPLQIQDRGHIFIKKATVSQGSQGLVTDQPPVVRQPPAR